MPTAGITPAPLPHSRTAQEQSCEQAQSCCQQPSTQRPSRSLALDPSEIPGVPITTHRRKLCIWYSAVPVFENRLSLRIHIFSCVSHYGYKRFSFPATENLVLFGRTAPSCALQHCPCAEPFQEVEGCHRAEQKHCADLRKTSSVVRSSLSGCITLRA